MTEADWNEGAVRSLLAHLRITKEYHAFLVTITGGHPAIRRAVRDLEESYAWLIKLASGPSGQVAE